MASISNENLKAQMYWTAQHKTCNVLMRDYRGMHRLNNDFLWTATPKQIAKKYGFDFAPGSVQINTVPIDDGMLDVHLSTLLGIDEILYSYRKTARFLIMGNDLSQLKKPKKNAEAESGTNTIVEESEDSI